MKNTVYQFTETLNNGKVIGLQVYQNSVLLIVNTASQCGFTPQYEGLQQLQNRYHSQGFEILGFPCNQFGRQEPGSDNDIQKFCNLTYQISFPLFKKVEINGANTSALYKYLKTNAPGVMGSKSIKWNFTKFLINKKGQVVKRYASTTKPSDIEEDIKNLLKE
ncbi:MAG: glutathione peroxidase [Paraglaciecola sp.]|uniref:glutathione peroxidase n=1 Tax=Paraglaciecola sp. TaxID=1920173 RepID=UPI00329A55BA